MYYETKGKHVINVGSSRPDRHSILLCKHAEEFALKDIKRYLSKKKIRKFKDIRIVIWKQTKEGILKTIDCCSWCKKNVLKNGLQECQIITPCIVDEKWNGKFRSSIIEHAKPPVWKTKL